MCCVWYPYQQMQNLDVQHEVVSAEGVYLYLDNGSKLIDAISSWWCVIHGYNHPQINEQAISQIKEVAHVMLGGLTHKPVKNLAKKLVEITPKDLNYVFFSDSGSVGVEVALKMAIQYWRNNNKSKKNRFLALKKAYHGDTCGVMAVGDPDDGMHALFSGFLPKQFFLPAPSMGYEADSKQLERDLQQLGDFLRNEHHRLAAFIVEPLMQAAGGFNFYAPLYLKEAKKLCDKYEVLLIFDEVATGFGRTGTLFAADQTGISPDIMVLAKGLTAGYTGHAATLASTRVFEAFLSEDS
jgi:adenosylmethionine---8-amino-7-oxononanoate aminotransferase